MDIRDELDAMLNNLKNGTPKSTPKSSTPPPAPRKSVYDKMSVDELVSSLSGSSKPKEAAPVQKPVQEPQTAPVTDKNTNNGIPQNILDMLGDTDSDNAKPRFASFKKKSAVQTVKTSPADSPTPIQPEKPKKKRIVISGELPDYEEIRSRSLKEDAERAEREAREQAEREAREQAEREAKEQAEREAREQAEREAKEQAERDAREQAERDAREQAEREAVEADDETEEETSEEDESVEEMPKKGFFAGLKSLFSKKDDGDDDDSEEDESSDDDGETDNDEDSDESSEEPDEIPDTTDDTADEDIFVNDSQLSASELIDKALAAIEDEGIISDETPIENASEDETTDSVDSLIADIREDAANTIAEIEENDSPVDEAEDVGEAPLPEQDDSPADIDIAIDTPRQKGRIVTALEAILDEDPSSLSDERREKAEADEDTASKPKKKSKGGFKRTLYAVLGVVFTLLAVVGLISSISYGIDRFRRFSAGETKRDRFTEVIYPAVIMDIESFSNPSELASDQIISAALWSFVMEGDFSKYTVTFDIISVPAVDVEAFAAQLFGENLPAITHATVGSGELKFYYNEAQKCYNVPVRPISFTYEPEITYVSKTGDDYTLTVDYIRELPAWMKDAEDYTPDISKTVEFNISEKDDSYIINSMTVINVNRVD